jgi:hypothetical protein
MYLEQLDDLAKRESGENKKFDIINDPKYERK